MSLDDVWPKNEEKKPRIIINHMCEKLIVNKRVFIIICTTFPIHDILNVTTGDYLVSA